MPSLYLIVAAIVLAIFMLTRLGLLMHVGIDSVPPALWPGLFLKGLWFDLAVGCTLLAPVLLYEAALPNRWRQSRWHGVLRLLWLWIFISILLFGAVSEATFWLEFSTRFNFIALDYLIYTAEVIGNIRQSYPVGWIISGIGLTAAVVAWRLAARIHLADQSHFSAAQRIGLAAAAIALPTLLLNLASIEQMQTGGNAYASELAGNGLFTMAAAARRNELDYNQFYRTIAQSRADATLRDLGVERQPLLDVIINDGGAEIDPNDLADDKTPFSRAPRNVILISVESLSASFVGAYGSTEGLTPRIDELAGQGLKFENVYATGTRTVRGLEALSLGTPPIPGQAIVRRPGNEHLVTIGEILEHQGFGTYFFGSSGNRVGDFGTF